jgi:ankyrin repeat protein
MAALGGFRLRGKMRPCNHSRVETIMKYAPADELLIQALDSGDRGAVQSALDKGANIDAIARFDKIKQTPLLMAAQRGDLAAVKMLVEFGADMAARNFYGVDACAFSCVVGSLECLEYLMAAGASYDAPDADGHTALMAAVIHGQERCVALLCSRGANLDVVDGEGRSPAQAALVRGHGRVVAILAAERDRRAIVADLGGLGGSFGKARPKV